MASAQESQLQPLSLKQIPLDLNDPTVRMLFELLTWFRGDTRVGIVTPAALITANQAISMYIEPPDQGEEWELSYVWVGDRAVIDINDVVTVFYGDYKANLDLMLQQTTLKTSTYAHADGSPYFETVFPNRDTARPLGDIVTSLTDQGFIVKRKDNKERWIAMRIVYAATATVGSRNVGVFYVYRRRKLI